LVRGFRDIEAAELRRQEAMLATIRRVYETYGFEPLETPAFEYTDALGKFLPDQDRPNAGVFSLQDVTPQDRGEGRSDGDEPWMSLRYDLTAPLARFVAQNYDRLPKPYRRYAVGNVYRNEKPGPGRYRQFMQFDADTVGADSIAADAEMCMLAADTLEALGIKGKFVVKISNRKVFDGLRERLGLLGADHNAQWLTVMRALDKQDKFDWPEIAKLLGDGRKDASGDFTPGARLSSDQIFALQAFTQIRLAPGQSESIPEFWRSQRDEWREWIGQTEAGQLGLDEFEQIANILCACRSDLARFSFDVRVIRGLEYYTGPVFEAELTFEVKGDDGQPVRFGSVGGGGRYDDLIARFTGERVPATGFSIGVSRLQAALALIAKDEAPREIGPVVVLVMDKAELPRYQALTNTLRRAGIRAEMYLGSAGMKAQMKYADRRNAAVVVIQGSNEREAGQVQLKDLIEGEKAAAAFKDNAEWKAARPAQITVSEAEMVAEVQRIIARYA